MLKIIFSLFFYTVLLGNILYSVDSFPYKIDLNYGSETINPYSKIDLFAKQILPIDYSNYSKFGVTYFDSNIGYHVMYEQNHPHGLISVALGEQFQFKDPLFLNSYIYPSATFFGASWHNVFLKYWALDSDSFVLLQFHDLLWASHFKQYAIDAIDTKETLSIGAKVDLSQLNLELLSQIQSSLFSEDNSTNTSVLFKLDYKPTPFHILSNIPITPELSFISVTHSDEMSESFLPNNSNFMLSSFYQKLNDVSSQKSIELLSSQFIFDVNERFKTYVKYSTFSEARLISPGFIFQFRNNLGFQGETQFNSLEDGASFFIRCVMFDHLII